MRALFLLSFASACGFPIGAGPGDPPSDASGSDMLSDEQGPLDEALPDGAPPPPPIRRLTIAPRATTLANFPVYVEITDAALTADAGNSTPYFTRTDGSAIPYQIQRWSAGTLEAWVQVTIDATSPTSFDLRVGDAGNPPQPAVVFGAPYAGVWHFEGAQLADAGGGNNGTAVSAPAAAAGKLGGGLRFDGTDDEVRINNPYRGDTSHTFSAWVSSTTAAGNGTIVTVGDPSTNSARWFHTRFPNLAGGFYNANDFRPTAGGTALPAGFHLVHWVYEINGGDRRSRLYLDGALVATSNNLSNANNTTTAAGHIGNAPAGFGESAFAGTLDEVRLTTVARNGAWILAEHANQSAPSAFYAIDLVDP